MKDSSPEAIPYRDTLDTRPVQNLVDGLIPKIGKAGHYHDSCSAKNNISNIMKDSDPVSYTDQRTRPEDPGTSAQLVY